MISLQNSTINSNSEVLDRNLMGFTILFGIYAGAVAVCGLHGAKLVSLGPLTFDAGLITYAVPFLVTDICSEVYGTKYSKKIVLGGFFAMLIVMLMTTVSLYMPESDQWTLHHEYETIFNAGTRITFAALCTFVASQLVDIYVFKLIKSKTGEKFLWLRNNVSTLVGGLVDAIVFTTIAFYGVYDVVPIIISAYIVRIGLSLLDTPLVYLGVWYLRRNMRTSA